MFLSLAEGHHDWMTDDGSSTLPSSACTHLTRIYTTIAKQLEADNFLPQALDYLLKAHKNAKESKYYNHFYVHYIFTPIYIFLLFKIILQTY